MESEKRIFYRKLWGLVFPIAIQNLMTALVSASDAFMLGFVSQTSLSAVSLATQIQFVHNLFMLALTIGATTLAAQYWGKGDTDSVEEILAIVLKISMAVSVVFFIAAMFFSGFLMRIFTNDIRLIQAGIPYLRIVSVSYLFMGFSQIYLCIMKNSGKTAKSTLIGSSSMILNIIFNVIFIFGIFGIPGMGIPGAAIATVLAVCIQLVWTLSESIKQNSIKIKVSYLFHTDKTIQKDFNRYTLPIVGNYFFWGGGVTIFSAIIGHLGNDAVAASSLVNIVRNTLACVSKGLGTAGVILVGNELGKNNIGLAKQYAKHSVKLAGIIGVVTCILLILMRPLILKFSGLTETATGYLSGMLLICSYYMIAGSINNMVIGGIFCAGGKSKFGCICDGVVLWLIVMPAALSAAFYFKLPVLAVYFILCLDECIKIPIVFWYYRKYTWAQNLTKR